MFGMLLSGSLNTLILKFQNSSSSDVDGVHYKRWSHPFAQSVFMFIGESGCFVVYIFMQYYDRKKYGSVENSPAIIEAKAKGLKTKMNPILLLIPSIFDNLSSSLMFIALGFLQTSIY